MAQNPTKLLNHKSFYRFFIAFALLLANFSMEGYAQDANYWTPEFGPGGFLSPGSVIAYNRDSGVVFYNPALLAYSHKSTASITGNVYQLESIRYKNGAGTGLDLSYTNGSIIPLIGSGTVAFKGKHPFSIGYALIRNPITSFSATQRKDALMNVLSDTYSPGPEEYVGQISENLKRRDTAQRALGHGFLGGRFIPQTKLFSGLYLQGPVQCNGDGYRLPAHRQYPSALSG
jgi:hypothetical protein